MNERVVKYRVKRIIITGASDGLGAEFAKLCVEDGIEVIELSRTRPDYKCLFIEADLTKKNSIMNACNIIKNKYPKFDALINCAGVVCKQKTNCIKYDELDNLIRINTIAPIYLVSNLLDLIKENGADILNVGSTIGTKPYLDHCAYGASKWALRGTSLNLQLELAKTRCRVIQFNPGGMNTRIVEKYNGEKIENPDEYMDPKDVAALMLYTLNLPKQLEISEITVNRKLKGVSCE